MRVPCPALRLPALLSLALRRLARLRPVAVRGCDGGEVWRLRWLWADEVD